LRTIPSHFEFGTLTASARAVAAYVCIGICKFMAVVAVCLCCVACLKGVPSQRVLSHCYGFEVQWIYASTIPAKMVESKPVWDSSDDEDVRVAMRHDPFSRSRGELSVAAICGVTSPIPARVSLVNEPPESNMRRVFLRGRKWIAIPIPTAVMHLAESVTEYSSIASTNRAYISHDGHCRRLCLQRQGVAT
jgi:hypothetical protein